MATTAEQGRRLTLAALVGAVILTLATTADGGPDDKLSQRVAELERRIESLEQKYGTTTPDERSVADRLGALERRQRQLEKSFQRAERLSLPDNVRDLERQTEQVRHQQERIEDAVRRVARDLRDASSLNSQMRQNTNRVRDLQRDVDGLQRDVDRLEHQVDRLEHGR